MRFHCWGGGAKVGGLLRVYYKAARMGTLRGTSRDMFTTNLWWNGSQMSNRITIRNAKITILIPLEYFDVMDMKSLQKIIPPRIFWCNDYVSRRRWGKRCKSDKLREIIRPEFSDVSQDEIITRNNSLKIKWWNVILEFPMVIPRPILGGVNAFALRANWGVAKVWRLFFACDVHNIFVVVSC